MANKTYSIARAAGRHWRWVLLGLVLLLIGRAYWPGAKPPATNLAPIVPAKAPDLATRCAKDAPAAVEKARAEMAAGRANAALDLLTPCIAHPPDDAAREFQFTVFQAARAEDERAQKAELAQRKKAGVSVGMTTERVLQSNWGKPQRVNRTDSAGGSSEQWVYGGGNYLYFRNGVLQSISTAR